jgi:hypothetical protein
MNTNTICRAALLVLQLLALVAPAQAAQPNTIAAVREWTDAQGSYLFDANARIIVDKTSSESVSATHFPPICWL